MNSFPGKVFIRGVQEIGAAEYVLWRNTVTDVDYICERVNSSYYSLHDAHVCVLIAKVCQECNYTWSAGGHAIS